MRRTIPLGLLLVACTSSAPEPGAPTEPVEEGVESTPPTGPCAQQISKYLADRKQLSRCETDSDCAEMWPGLCPHGPYYIDRDADIEAVVALEREIMATCEIPECEPPMELGIAHCEQGTCARGRKPEHKRELGSKYNYDMSCWDFRETWLEADGAATATASSVHNGVTPHVAIAPASPGVLTLELDWPASCVDCRLLISEHNSGMANRITPKSTRSEAQRNGEPIQRERLEFPVTPGPYHFVAMASSDTDYTIRAELRDAEGQPGRVTRHGVDWQHMCEG
jgi:hypothetical protein